MKRMKSNLKVTVSLLTATGLLLAGCGGTENGRSGNPQQGADAENLGIYYSVEEESFFEPEDFLPLEAGEFCDRERAFLTKDYVSYFSWVLNADNSGLYSYLQVYDRQQKNWGLFDEKGDSVFYEGESYRIAAHTPPFGGLDGRMYQVVYGEEKSYLAEINGEKIQRIAGELTDKEETLCIQAESYKYADREGRFYLADNDNLRLYCYDANMKPADEVAVPGMVYGILQGKEGEDVCWYGLDARKNPVVKRVTDGKTVAENIEGIGTEYRAAMAEDGSLYFADTQNMWKYTDGTLLKVFAFVQNDYLLSEIYGMECTEQGDVELLTDMDSELVLLTLHQADSLPEKKEIVLADYSPTVQLQKLIARFNRQSREYYVTCRVPDEGQEWADFQQVINLELSNGNGPDMFTSGLLLDVEDYAEKGYLKPVDELVDDPEQFGSGVLEDQKIGDTLYGIPYECSFFLSSYRMEDLGDRTAITLPEFTELVENSDADIIEENMGGVDLLVYYILYDNDDTTYIDWEEGKSHLDSEEFLRMLEFAEKYADRDNTDKKAFAMSSSMTDISTIKTIYSSFRGNASLIGFPCKDGNGIYVSTNAVYKNAATKNPGGVDTFLRFLISEREQKRYDMYSSRDMIKDGYGSVTLGEFPVRKDAYQKKVTKEVRESYQNDFYGTQIPYTDEMTDWIYFIRDHAKPDNPHIYAVYRILQDELTPYFDGSISAKEAAERLQNRVQLYLNER